MSWKLSDLEQSLLIGSTLVEGSTLTETEACDILAGRTVQGHPIDEIRELLNYRSAVESWIKALRVSPYLSSDLLLDFHSRLFAGLPASGGQWKKQANYTYRKDGSRHDYLRPELVKGAIQEWLGRFNEKPSKKISPAAVAAQLYYDFQEIHPFEDGNGRIGRIAVAYWLHWRAKLGWSFFLKDKTEHLLALEAANDGDLEPLTKFLKKRTRGESA